MGSQIEVCDLAQAGFGGCVDGRKNDTEQIAFDPDDVACRDENLGVTSVMDGQLAGGPFDRTGRYGPEQSPHPREVDELPFDSLIGETQHPFRVEREARK